MAGGSGAAHQCTAAARRVLAALSIVAACLLALPALAAAQPDFTWSGASGLDQNWSDPANWAGSTAPGGTVDTLSFPACASPGCYHASNDLSGLAADALSIDDGQPYVLSGDGLSLGAGGLTASTTNSTITGTPALELPLTLTADQTWAIDGSTGGGMQVSGPLSGPGGLTLSLTGDAPVAVSNLGGLDDELGPVTVTGSGTLTLGLPGVATSLDAGDGNAVDVGFGAGLLAQGNAQLGPLTVAGGGLQVGNAAQPATLGVDGAASLDSTSTLSLFIQSAGTTPGTDYSQLEASGSLDLGGSELSLAAGMCPTLNPGDVDTLVSAGALSGTFAGLPDGSVIHFPCSGGPAPAVRINYTPTSVTATVLGPTTTSLTAAPAAPDTNQTVTLTATVTAGSSTPAGTVAFENGGTVIPGCSAQPLSAGVATCQTAFTATSSPESLSAVYAPGSVSYLTSTGTLSLPVGQDATTTALSLPPASVGQGDTYTATVTPADGGAALPSGEVEFLDGGTPIAGCTAQTLVPGSNSSSATCTVPTFTAASAHTIAATYEADANFAGSTAAQTLNVSPASTSTALTAFPSAPDTNQAVTLTATVTSGYQTPSGTVAFADGGTPIPGCGAQPVNGSGEATCQIAFAAEASPAALSALYTPDTGDYQGSSGSLSLPVASDPTSTSVGGPSGTTAGANVTFTATVSPQDSGATVPSGTVEFFSATGAPISGCTSQPLSSGTASCSFSLSAPGSYSISAAYSGDPNFAASSSLGATLAVAQAASTTSLSLNHTAPVTNQPITLTATVAGADGAPAGTVSFADDGTAIPGCTAQPVGAGGTATCASMTGPGGQPIALGLAAGSASLTAAYSGDSDYAASTSATDTVAVSPDVTALALAGPGTPAVVGQPAIFTADVTPAHSGPIPLSGVLTFEADGAPVAGCVDLPASGDELTTSCHITFATLGSHTVTATYGSDPNFLGRSRSASTTVFAATSTTSLSASPAAAVTNEPVTLTAKVASGAQGSPAGTVTFSDGGTPISGCGARTVDGSGEATCQVSFAAVSSPDMLSAAYAPSSPDVAGSTGGYALSVGADAVDLQLSSSSVAPAIGQAVTYRATVIPSHGGAALPTGTIQFRDNGAPLGACRAQPLTGSGSSALATCTTSYATAGAHTITAVYDGDGNFEDAFSSAQEVTVPVPPPPVLSATTLRASSITSTGAVLSGIVNTGGAAVGWQFEYGTKLPYTKATPLQTIPAGHGLVGVTARVKLLAPAALYHFQIVVFTVDSESSTTAFGRELTLTTRPVGKVGLLAGRMSANSGHVLVPLRCASAAGCAGRLVIATRVGGRARLCGAASYRLAAHTAATVRARLSAACVALLHRGSGSLRATLTATPVAKQLPVSRTVLIRLG